MSEAQTENKDQAESAAPEVEPTVQAAASASSEKSDSEKNTPKWERDKADAFSLLNDTLEKADWGYKNQTGSARDLGFQSVALAERAFVHASTYNLDDAVDRYKDITGAPPPGKLMDRAIKAQSDAPKDRISDLTAGIADVTQKRHAWDVETSQQRFDDQRSRWESTAGDMLQRREQSRRSRNDRLLTAEQDRDGSGLGLVFRSFRSGMAAGHEGVMAKAYERKRLDIRDGLDKLRKDHESLVAQGASFQPKEGPGIPRTIGPVGMVKTKFGGAFSVASDILKEVGKAGRDGPSPAMNPGQSAQRNAGIGAALMAQQGQSQGQAL